MCIEIESIANLGIRLKHFQIGLRQPKCIINLLYSLALMTRDDARMSLSGFYWGV
jgi:hypothetical protein